MSIILPAGKTGPGDARQFVGNGHHHLIAWSTLCQSPHPLSESSSVEFDAKQYCASTVDQHATQIDFAALADAVQFLLATSRVLSWHHPNPGREVATATKGSAVADRSYGGIRNQRAKAWDLAKLPRAGVPITY